MSSLLASATSSAADAAHAAAASIFATAQIKPGAKLPDIPVKEDNPEKATLSLASLQGRVLIVGVPGAFTPPCSSHVPGFISSYDKLADKGVRGVYVVAVNDVFVTKAWKAHLAKDGTQVHFIADDKGTFTSAIGLLFDASPLLGGPRSKRYVLVVEDGTVSAVHIEGKPSDVNETTADRILASL